MSTVDIQTKEISITEAAAIAVKDLLEKKELTDHALRVYIAGSGCSGYQYGMALEIDPRPTDFIFEQFGIKVLVDEASMEYMNGSTVDYINDETGTGFKIDNPAAPAGCGCDSSAEGQSHSHEGGGCGNGSCGC